MKSEPSDVRRWPVREAPATRRLDEEGALARPGDAGQAGSIWPRRFDELDAPLHPAQTPSDNDTGVLAHESAVHKRDLALMRRVRERDEEAFATLYDRYAAQVNGLALSILRNPALSEDATHDVFLRLWQQPDAYDPSRGVFRGWLLRVARNRAIDLIRRRREHSAGGLEHGPAAWIPNPAPDPEEQTMIQQRRQEVRLALGDLTPDQRHLLELAYFTGLSQSQIANQLERPLGTVKSQIRAAMRRLTDCLGERDQAAPGAATPIRHRARDSE